MIIKTARLGEIEIAAENIVTFDSGLLGFEYLNRFVLFDIAEKPNFKWMQCIDNPEIAFLLVDPFTVKEDYYVDLNEELIAALDITVPEDVLIYTIVNIPPSGLQDATTNMVGPLIFNWTKKNAKQIIYEAGNSIIKYPLLANAL